MPGTINHSPLRQTKSKAHRHQRIGRACLETLEDRRLLSFSPAVNYPVAPNPRSVVTADFNNDGNLDRATGVADSRYGNVLLGNGAGGFSAAQQFDGWYPWSLAAADFNGDGNMDLVTVQGSNADTSVLFGNGNGTFQSPVDHWTWYGPLGVAVGDFNNDANIDIVTSQDDGNSFGWVQVQRGNGTGGFANSPAYQITGPTDAMAVGDVNNDGKLDVVALVGNGWSLLGNGDGTFLEPDPWYKYEFWTGANRCVALGDFTGDGTLDAIAAGETVNVMVGRGDGFFGEPVSHAGNGAMHTAVATADFNSDGKLDAVTTDGDTGTVSMMLATATAPCGTRVRLPPALRPRRSRSATSTATAGRTRRRRTAAQVQSRYC
jgi:hypothetical protein